MKNFIPLFILLCVAIVSCEEESKPTDPIFEFVAFKGPSAVNVNELANSENAYPLVVELKAFKPYSEDLDVSLEITGNNAEENVDFTVTPGELVKIRAGKLVSD